MKVGECRDCKYCVRRCWTQYYQPKNYHAIGMTHAYAFCKKHDRRVSEIKSCDEKEGHGGNQGH